MHNPQPPIDGPLLKAWFATVVLCLVSAVRRYVRITVSVISLVACMLLIAMWVRSYWWFDSLHNEGTWLQPEFGLWSFHGRLCFHGSKLFPFSTTCELNAWPMNDHSDWLRASPMWWYRNDVLSVIGCRQLIFPYWFPVLLTSSLAAVLGIRRPYRFSLRTLLIAVTVIAAWLGFIVAIM